MQLNVLFTNRCVQLCKFIVSSAVVCLQSHCCDVKWQKIVMRVRKSWKSWKTGVKTEVKTESQNAATTLWSLRQDRWLRKRGVGASEAKKHVAVLRNDHILAFSDVLKTSHVLLSSHCSYFVAHGPIVPKARATPTNSNAHVSIQRLLRCVHKEYTMNTYT